MKVKDEELEEVVRRDGERVEKFGGGIGDYLKDEVGGVWGLKRE